MKKFHIALGVSNIEQTVKEYSQRLAHEADVVIAGEYALWRTPTLNLSIRKVSGERAGQLRHLGWENPNAATFSIDKDNQGIAWENFTAQHQAEEIESTWPGTGYLP